ncbi:MULTISPECIES: hypothetical protein [unclassified Nocardioides]|uniref:hypothetical protein n=1 Tax=unclassified Nocardioides TaxID=2615069 RepID=UPI0030152D7E
MKRTIAALATTIVVTISLLTSSTPTVAASAAPAVEPCSMDTSLLPAATRARFSDATLDRIRADALAYMTAFTAGHAGAPSHLPWSPGVTQHGLTYAPWETTWMTEARQTGQQVNLTLLTCERIIFAGLERESAAGEAYVSIHPRLMADTGTYRSVVLPRMQYRVIPAATSQGYAVTADATLWQPGQTIAP